jgi:hypothetical protein
MEKKFAELPFDPDDADFGLEKDYGIDRLGYKHAYHVYTDPETEELVLSVGDESFLNIHPNDGEIAKASKQFFRSIKDNLEHQIERIRELKARTEIDPVEEFSDDEIHKLTPEQQKKLLDGIKENLKIKISKRKPVINRLELYKLINKLEDEFNKLPDECKSENIKMLLMQIKTLSDSLNGYDLVEKKAEEDKRLEELRGKSFRIRGNNPAATPPPFAAPRPFAAATRPFAAATRPFAFAPGSGMGYPGPARQRKRVEEQNNAIHGAAGGHPEAAGGHPAARRKFEEGGSTHGNPNGGGRLKSSYGKRIKKTLKSSNKLKKNNKNKKTKKVKSRK